MSIIYDPDSIERGHGEEVRDSQARLRRAIDLLSSIAHKRRSAGRMPYMICVINRESGEHRWQNIAPTYAGSVSNAENLLGGRWRVATFAEEDACKQRDVEAQKAELEFRAQIKMADLVATGRGLISAVHSAEAERQKQPTKNGDNRK